MKLIQRMLFLVAVFTFVFGTQSALAQCGKFADSPREKEAIEAHVL